MKTYTVLLVLLGCSLALGTVLEWKNPYATPPIAPANGSLTLAGSSKTIPDERLQIRCGELFDLRLDYYREFHIPLIEINNCLFLNGITQLTLHNIQIALTPHNHMCADHMRAFYRIWFVGRNGREQVLGQLLVDPCADLPPTTVSVVYEFDTLFLRNLMLEIKFQCADERRCREGAAAVQINIAGLAPVT